MQDRKPVVRESLDRVGVTNLRAIVLTSWKGGRYNFVPEIELTRSRKSLSRDSPSCTRNPFTCCSACCSPVLTFFHSS
ncbi:MAG: hypothetical protein U9Q22_02840, partial [Candidatus Altiarchaeota archaeon]|nr:hypothetical protein [Candidatus Altiarchaeota archaeon]